MSTEQGMGIHLTQMIVVLYNCWQKKYFSELEFQLYDTFNEALFCMSSLLVLNSHFTSH